MTGERPQLCASLSSSTENKSPTAQGHVIKTLGQQDNPRMLRGDKEPAWTLVLGSATVSTNRGPLVPGVGWGSCSLYGRDVEGVWEMRHSSSFTVLHALQSIPIHQTFSIFAEKNAM